MLLRSLLTLAGLLHLSAADITFTTPAAGAVLTGTTLDIEWTDSGSPVLTSYSLFLCAGGNTDASYIQLATLKDNGDPATGKLSATVTPGLGASETNAYFFKLIGATTGGSIINFSSRFSLSAMTGTFPANVEAGVKSITGTAGPANADAAAAAANDQQATVASIDASEFAVAYTMQTGPTKFAPMQAVPSSKITAKAPSAQYSPFPYSLYTTGGPAPNAQTTVTQAQTFSVASREPDISAAGQPFDSDLQKFLNRWKD